VNSDFDSASPRSSIRFCRYQTTGGTSKSEFRKSRYEARKIQDQSGSHRALFEQTSSNEETDCANRFRASKRVKLTYGKSILETGENQQSRAHGSSKSEKSNFTNSIRSTIGKYHGIDLEKLNNFNSWTVAIQRLDVEISSVKALVNTCHVSSSLSSPSQHASRGTRKQVGHVSRGDRKVNSGTFPEAIEIRSGTFPEVSEIKSGTLPEADCRLFKGQFSETGTHPEAAAAAKAAKI